MREDIWFRGGKLAGQPDGRDAIDGKEISQ